MAVTTFGSFEYPANGGWKKETGEKNIASELGIRTGRYTSYTIEIETKKPTEIKLDGDSMKTARIEATPDIYLCKRNRRGSPSARGVSELIIPAGVEYRVRVTGTGER